MSIGKQVSFDQYLDILFAEGIWLDGCTTMLAVFLEDIETGRDNPRETLPDIAPSIVDQVTRVSRHAHGLEQSFRALAQERGPAFQTNELGAALWWAGMAAAKADASAQEVQKKMASNDWPEAYFEIHRLMYETICALSLLSVAERIMRRQEDEQERGGARPN